MGAADTHSTCGTTAPATTTWRISACCPAGHDSNTGADAADCTLAGVTGREAGGAGRLGWSRCTGAGARENRDQGDVRTDGGESGKGHHR